MYENCVGLQRLTVPWPRGAHYIRRPPETQHGKRFFLGTFTYRGACSSVCGESLVILAPVNNSTTPLPTRQVVAVVTGNAIEFYDFVTYAFFAAQIGRTFFPSLLS